MPQKFTPPSETRLMYDFTEYLIDL